MNGAAALRGRRGAFVALGAVVCLFALFVALPVAALFNAQADDRDELLRELAAYRNEDAARPALEAQLRTLRLGAMTVPGLLTGSNAALAQAQLQSDMKVLIDQNGGSLLSAQLLPPAKVNGFDMVSIEFDLTLPLGHLSSLMYAIETHTPYYFLDGADLVMPPNWRPGNPQTQDPSMELRWTVHGYRWAGAR